MIKARKATLYSLFCDNCGRRFEGNDYDEFFDVDDMLDEAADDADWVGLYDGKKEPKEEFDHLSYAEQHFCCEECREKWLKRRRFRRGDLVRMGKREFVLEGDEEEDGTVSLLWYANQPGKRVPVEVARRVHGFFEELAVLVGRK